MNGRRRQGSAVASFGFRRRKRETMFKEQPVELVDLVGPYAGRIRPYSKTAAENAIASGFARRPDDGGPELVAETVEELDAETDTTPLPDDFPARPALVAARLETIEAVEACDDLTAIDGIGKATVERIASYLRGLS